MVLKKIEKQSAEDMAANALRDYILGGQIRPGAKLTEAFLAQKFSLSRATVRGALKQMAQEGLAFLVPYTGWEVMALTSHDAWELYTLRASLESLAARLASEHINEDNASRLKSAYGKVEQACASRHRDQISATDFALHRTIIEISGNSRLAQQYRFIEQQVALYIMWSDFLPENVHVTVLKHHGPIVQAILDGDGELAARLSAEHNEAAGKKLVNHLRKLEQEADAEENVPGGKGSHAG